MWAGKPNDIWLAVKDLALMNHILRGQAMPAEHKMSWEEGNPLSHQEDLQYIQTPPKQQS